MSHPKGFPATPARRLPGGLWLLRLRLAGPGCVGPHEGPPSLHKLSWDTRLAFFWGREGSESRIGPGPVSLRQPVGRSTAGITKGLGQRVLGSRARTPTPGDPGCSSPRPHTRHLLLVVSRPQERAAHLLTVPVRHTVSACARDAWGGTDRVRPVLASGCWLSGKACDGYTAGHLPTERCREACAGPDGGQARAGQRDAGPRDSGQNG